MHWRYQTLKHEDGSCSLVELHFDDNDQPTGWISVDRGPVGNNREDLVGELKLMLADAQAHKPMTRAELDFIIHHEALHRLHAFIRHIYKE